MEETVSSAIAALPLSKSNDFNNIVVKDSARLNSLFLNSKSEGLLVVSRDGEVKVASKDSLTVDQLSVSNNIDVSGELTTGSLNLRGVRGGDIDAGAARMSGIELSNARIKDTKFSIPSPLSPSESYGDFVFRGQVTMFFSSLFAFHLCVCGNDFRMAFLPVLLQLPWILLDHCWFRL